MIRELRREDAPAAAALVARLRPHEVMTAPLLLHRLEKDPPRAHNRAWVAEADGEIVGWAQARFSWTVAEPGVGRVWVGVDEPVRGRGLGSGLYETAERHLVQQGGRRLYTGVADAAGIAFAERRGFSRSRVEHFSALDPRGADLTELPALEEAKRRDGFRLAPLGELRDRLPELHALYASAERDTPGDEEETELDRGDWERETLANPLLDDDGSFNVVHGERPVSFAWLLVDRDGGRAEHELTGTLPEYRGRGLARLAKLAAIRWCRDNGIRELMTANDDENAPMLAINRRLGYRPTVDYVEMVKTIETESASAG